MAKNPNDYEKQKERALKRKLSLIIIKGGKCEKCGYHKNISALEFHHVDRTTKSFQLDARHLSNTKLDKIVKEAEKCILVCANCHRELHNPSLSDENIQTLLNETTDIKIEKEKKKSICEHCGSEFPYVKGKKFCSKACREAHLNYPTKDELLEKYSQLGNWQKTYDFFKITRKIALKIRNK